jgi:hypothetical protein
MLFEGFQQLLKTQSSLKALLGDPTSRADKTTGIFPVLAPEGCTMPVIVASQVSGGGTPSMDGANALHTARIQFSCYASAGQNQGFTMAKKLARALRGVLEGWRGTLPDGTEVDSTQLMLELDLFEEAPFEYHTVLHFAFTYRDVGA